MADQENPVEEIAAEAMDNPMPRREIVTAPTWPRDVYGITSGLRRELARVAGRLNGDPDKFDVFMNTLRVGAGWGKSRMEIQQKTRTKQLNTIAAREAAANAAQEKANANVTIKSDAERAADQRAAGIQGAVQSKA